MTPLELVCKGCGSRFASGVPLEREHLEGVKLRTLEVCTVCGTAADYSKEDYLESSIQARATPPETPALHSAGEEPGIKDPAGQASAPSGPPRPQV